MGVQCTCIYCIGFPYFRENQFSFSSKYFRFRPIFDENLTKITEYFRNFRGLENRKYRKFSIFSKFSSFEIAKIENNIFGIFNIFEIFEFRNFRNSKYRKWKNFLYKVLVLENIFDILGDHFASGRVFIYLQTSGPKLVGVARVFIEIIFSIFSIFSKFSYFRMLYRK